MKATLVLSGQDLPSSGSEDQGALEARKSSGHGESSGEKAEKRRYRERPCNFLETAIAKLRVNDDVRLSF
jgi:hypothetical protein